MTIIAESSLTKGSQIFVLCQNKLKIQVNSEIGEKHRH